MSMRVVLYGRVSQDRYGQSKSVDQQLDQGRRWADALGATVVGVFRDDNVSASGYARRKTARADWTRVMEVIASGGTDMLWLWELSRSTRDRAVWAALIGACQGTGTKIAIDGKVSDPDDPDEAFDLDLKAMLAVRESGVTRKRIRRDVTSRADSGRPHGRLPYGFIREYDPHTGALIRQAPDPEVRAPILDAATRFAAGTALYTLARSFTDNGVPRPHELRARRLGQPAPPPGDWTPNEVRRVISSPTTAGIRIHNGEEKTLDAWEPIIPVELHRRIVAKLGDPKRRTQRDGATKHLLSAILVCGACGSLCRRVKNRGTPSYSCARNHCVSRREAIVDECVSSAVLAYIRSNDFAEILRTESAAPDGADAFVAMRELQVRLDSFRDQAADGKLSADSLVRIEQRLLPQIEHARNQAMKASRSPTIAELQQSDDPRAWWDDMLDIRARRDVVRAVCVPTLHKTRPGTRKFDPESVTFEWR